jgi:hypothetical protein
MTSTRTSAHSGILKPKSFMSTPYIRVRGLRYLISPNMSYIIINVNCYICFVYIYSNLIVLLTKK